jgi:hypothetical protein
MRIGLIWLKVNSGGSALGTGYIAYVTLRLEA